MTDFEKVIEQVKSEILPFESWERLPGESGANYAAFCVFRDCGLDRSIRKAVDKSFNENEKNKARLERRYNVWRAWASQFRWKERAADFDRYIEKLKQTELRKTIEAQGEKHRQVTGKMLDVVNRKLDTINPDDLSNGAVTEWVTTAIKADREAAGLISNNDNTENKQGEFSFVTEFKGL